MKKLLATLSLLICLPWLAKAQTTGEQTFLGDVTFKNPARAVSSAVLQPSLLVAPGTASSTGTIVNGAASATADLQEWQLNGSTVTKVSANGGWAPRQLRRAQVDSRTPDFIGEIIEVIDYGAFGGAATSNFVLCAASGTGVAQYMTINSTQGVNMNGCGTGK